MFGTILGHCFQNCQDIVNRFATQSGVQLVESELLGFGFGDESGIAEFREEVRLQDKYISAECGVFHHTALILFPKVCDLAEWKMFLHIFSEL